MTTTKRNSNSGHKRRVLATVLALAATHGKGDGRTFAHCAACDIPAIVGLGASEDNRFELGHDVSEFNGGEYIVSNLHPLCGACNDDIGTANISDILIPVYDIHAGWNGIMVSDPGPRGRRAVSRKSQWNRK